MTYAVGHCLFFPVIGFFVVFGVLCGLVLAEGAAFLSTDFFAEMGRALGRATSGPYVTGASLCSAALGTAVAEMDPVSRTTAASRRKWLEGRCEKKFMATRLPKAEKMMANSCHFIRNSSEQGHFGIRTGRCTVPIGMPGRHTEGTIFLLLFLDENLFALFTDGRQQDGDHQGNRDQDHRRGDRTRDEDTPVAARHK